MIKIALFIKELQKIVKLCNCVNHKHKQYQTTKRWKQGNLKTEQMREIINKICADQMNNHDNQKWWEN